MKKLPALVVLLSATLFGPLHLAAEEPRSRCDAVLAARERVVVENEDLFLEAVARLSDERTLKASAEKLDIGLYDVISADGWGWRKAKERVRNNESRFTSRAQAETYLFEGPASGAISAWENCMAAGGPRFFAYIPRGLGSDKVTVVLYWSKGINDPTRIRLVNPPSEFGPRRFLGRISARFDRPSAADGPREVTIDGEYAIGWFFRRSESATVVIYPLSDPAEDRLHEVVLQASRLSSRGRCDASGHDGKNEYSLRLLVDDEVVFGPQTYPVAHSGSRRLDDIRVQVTAKEKFTVKLAVDEVNHGAVRTTTGEQSRTLDLHEASPAVFSLSATTTKRKSRRQCTATVDFTASW